MYLFLKLCFHVVFMGVLPAYMSVHICVQCLWSLEEEVGSRGTVVTDCVIVGCVQL